MGLRAFIEAEAMTQALQRDRCDDLTSGSEHA
jgi:hypothetical protein